ncbi:MAG: DUF4229 domain-containing protein [Actinomycetes bacterium]
MSTSTRSAWSIVLYTALRVIMFVGAWVLIELLTPITGLFAAAFAILISGAVSIIVLNGQRDAMSIALSSFFRRMNARIDASTRAEDVD